MQKDYVKKNWEFLLSLGIQAALFGGKEILQIYKGEYKINYKNDKSPVTEADIRSNDAIQKILYQKKNDESQNIPIISEELEVPDYNSRKKWEAFWLIGPFRWNPRIHPPKR